MRTLIILFCLIAFAPLAAHEGWTVERSLRVSTPGSVELSPDGREAIIESSRTLYISDLQGGLTVWQCAGSDCSCWSPAYSPDGRWVAFLSDRSGSPQLYLNQRRGGSLTQLTNIEGGVGEFKWSPRGDRIAFLRTIAMPGGAVQKIDDTEAYPGAELWVVELGRQRRLYQVAQGRRVGYGLGGMAQYDWSPCGDKIAFATLLACGADVEQPEVGLATANLCTGRLRVWEAEGECRSTPRYSPDGQWLAFLTASCPSGWDDTHHVAIASLDGGEIVELCNTPNEGGYTLFEWSGDSSALLLVEPSGTGSALLSLPVTGERWSRLDFGTAYFSESWLNRTRSHIGLVVEGPDLLPEAYFAAIDSFSPRRLSNFNSWARNLTTGQTYPLEWSSSDGQRIEGLVTLPPGYRQGDCLPLLLMIHGGPHYAFSESAIASAHPFPVAVLAECGYAVLRPNPRGSDGYGRTYRRAIEADWGGVDYRDFMAGVDHLIEEGIADPDRLGVMGWSYGGYLTAWTITQTDRFVAASLGAAMTDLISWAGTSDLHRVARGSLGDRYWEDGELYRERSPITHAYRVQTPTLIHHGEWDDRVPVGQAWEFYRTLRGVGVDAELLLYSGSGHSPVGLEAMRRCMSRNVEWFLAHIAPGPLARGD